MDTRALIIMACINIFKFLYTFKVLSTILYAGYFRLIAFNLGYLPGGDKGMITRSETTLLALEAAKRILMPGGLISLVVYVGHPGGW